MPAILKKGQKQYKNDKRSGAGPEKIEKNKKIVVCGPSGSGKSTLIDILLGLIEPHHGMLKVDNTIINSKNRRSWQNTIGFVGAPWTLLVYMINLKSPKKDLNKNFSSSSTLILF